MGIFNSIFKRNNAELRHIPHMESDPYKGFYGDGSLRFDSIVNGEYGPMSLAVVFRCVTMISSMLASVPMKLKMRSSGETTDVHDIPLADIFENKSDSIMSWYDTMRYTIQDVLLKGNGYLYIKRSKSGEILDLIRLEAGDVAIQWTKNNQKLVYTVAGISGIGPTVEPKDMIHIKFFSNDGITGASFLSYCGRSLKIAHASEDSALRYYNNGGMIAGILSTDKRLKDEQKRQTINNWHATYGAGSNGICILENGEKYTPIQTNAEDAQLLDVRSYNNRDIALFLGVPEQLLGNQEDSSYNGVTQLQRQFVNNVLLPWTNMITQEFERKLIKGTGMFIMMDTASIIFDDLTSRSQFYTRLLQGGVLCPNEVRAEMNLDPVDGLDRHFVSYTNIEDNSLTNGDKTTESPTETNMKLDNKKV